MKKIIKFNKNFISFFLAVMIIYSIGFKGVTVLAGSVRDTTPPTLTLTLNTRELTDTTQSIQITAKASDNIGLKNIILPNGTVVTNPSTIYTVSKAGTYTFVATDNSGNTTTQSTTVYDCNGDWNSENVIKANTSEAQLMVRVGDIDNFGFGWASVDPFSGVETAVHSFPFTPESNDPQGTDRIMTVTGYNTRYTTIGTNTDGYTRSTTSYAKTVNPVVINYNSYLSGVSVQNATIQMFLDDFQPGKAHGVTQGTVQYTATMNGVEIPELSNVINNLDESGPIGKLVTFQIPERYLDLIRTGSISLKFDDTNSCTGDGYAIDFVKLLINKTDATINTATVTGNVKDGSNNNNIQGATVSAGGVVTTTTDANGNYTLNNVPAGQAIVTASKSGYNTATVTIPTVIAGGGYTANFTLTPSTPPTMPTITATPTTPTNDKVTATINYSPDSSIQQYRIDIGGVTGEWKVYNGPFDVTQNCVIEAQGINQYGNESKIASYTVSNIDKTPPTLTLTQNPTAATKGIVTITASASDNVAVASITKPDSTVVTDSTSTTYTVSANDTYIFKATDTAGNVATQSINVSNIDNTPPVITIAPYNTSPTNQDIIVNASTDKGTLNQSSYTFTQNGSFTFVATDSLGNTSSKTVTITNIDKTAPTLTLTQDPTSETNGTVTITAAAADSGSGVASITKPDSTVVSDNTVTYTVSDNDTYIFTATDKAGNVTTQSIIINNIFAPSSISAHGIYSGSGIDMVNGNNVASGIPVTMAMIVDAESANPEIKLTSDDNTKITIDNTSFKGYEISEDNGIIGSGTPLTIDDSGNITGFLMEKDSRYLIVYAITPVGSGQVALNAAADGTSPKSVTLNIGAQPDLF